MSIRDDVVEIIAQELDIEVAAIADNSYLEELGADSVHLLEIVLGIEERLGIRIADGESAGFRIVQDVIAFVRRRAGR